MSKNMLTRVLVACCFLPIVPLVFNAAEDALARDVHFSMQRTARTYGLTIEGKGRAAHLALPGGRTIPYESEKILPGHPWSVADIRGLYRQEYPLTNVRYGIHDRERDPGRYRNYQLLAAVYGSSQEEVRRSLTTVDFCGVRVPFSARNGAAAALQRVAADIQKKPHLVAWIRRLVARDRQAIGTWCWRTIAGTRNLSAHSYGIAIDIFDRSSPKFAYWRFVARDPDRASRWPEFISHEKIWQPPGELVQCFERHGFIWGGKWYHFDPMHFEYRPEFFMREETGVH